MGRGGADIAINSLRPRGPQAENSSGQLSTARARHADLFYDVLPRHWSFSCKSSVSSSLNRSASSRLSSHMSVAGVLQMDPAQEALFYVCGENPGSVVRSLLSLEALGGLQIVSHPQIVVGISLHFAELEKPARICAGHGIFMWSGPLQILLRLSEISTLSASDQSQRLAL